MPYTSKIASHVNEISVILKAHKDMHYIGYVSLECLLKEASERGMDKKKVDALQKVLLKESIKNNDVYRIIEIYINFDCYQFN